MDDTENMRILRDMAMGRDVSAGDRVMAANWAVREYEALASEQQAGPVAQQFITPILPTGSREAAMVVIKRDASGTPTVWCDPEIVDLVRALNDAGIATVASCSGHGHRPGRVSLADGRELVIARGYDEARRIDGLFSTDINGEKEKGHAE